MKLRAAALASILAAATGLLVYAQQQPALISGYAVVTDGDTLKINGVRIRLAGIDAPESDQTCLDGQGVRYFCGARATDEMRSLTAGRVVTCQQQASIPTSPTNPAAPTSMPTCPRKSMPI